VLSDLQWKIAVWAWLLGIPGFPIAVLFGAEIPTVAYMGYSSLCLVIAANHPKIVKLMKALDDDRNGGK
jgi:hypothetical protein